MDLTASEGVSGPATDRRAIAIQPLEPDADPATSLAARGFAAAPFEHELGSGRGRPGWRARFAEAVARSVQKLVAARGVVVLPSPGRLRRGNGAGPEMALTTCHGDFTPASAAHKFATIQRKQPRARDARRFAAYNVWWLASEPPQDIPLALCDATTVAASDMVPGTAVIHDAEGAARDFGEIALYRFNPRHRWFWYPGLTSDRMLIFAGHDSDPRFASQVPHGAFANPDCPEGAPTRVSIECRCFAYW